MSLSVSAEDTSFLAVRRRLTASLRGQSLPEIPTPLEVTMRRQADAPIIREAEAIEDRPMRAHRIDPAAEPRFAAFLDGAQWSLVAHWQGGVPIVHGTVAASVRCRRQRRLVTWRQPLVRRALYAPLGLLAAGARQTLQSAGMHIVDTLELRDPTSAHPLALQEIAYRAVLADRERAEHDLAQTWCETQRDELFIDGGIAGNPIVAGSNLAVGVVKSHQTIYAGDNDLGVITALAAGERSSVMMLASSRGSSVATWYLRLRDAGGRDPFWGLVRVEVALGKRDDLRATAQRATEVSAWILAERLPLSVPDSRWDKMAYGIRDSEEYLRAVK